MHPQTQIAAGCAVLGGAGETGGIWELSERGVAGTLTRSPVSPAPCTPRNGSDPGPGRAGLGAGGPGGAAGPGSARCRTPSPGPPRVLPDPHRRAHSLEPSLFLSSTFFSLPFFYVSFLSSPLLFFLFLSFLSRLFLPYFFVL